MPNDVTVTVTHELAVDLAQLAGFERDATGAWVNATTGVTFWALDELLIYALPFIAENFDA